MWDMENGVIREEIVKEMEKEQDGSRLKDGESRRYCETGGKSYVVRVRKREILRQKGRKNNEVCERGKSKEKANKRERESVREGGSRRENYEWVLGVCILDPGQPLSDRERCGCSPW